MSETQSVFDSMLQDISTLQKTVRVLTESRDVENLETHLTERIATFTENSLEAIAVQGQSLSSLNIKVDELTTVVIKNKEQNKEKLVYFDEAIKANIEEIKKRISSISNETAD